MLLQAALPEPTRDDAQRYQAERSDGYAPERQALQTFLRRSGNGTPATDNAGVIRSRLRPAVENHSGVVQDVIDKVAIGRKAGIIPVLDMIS
jgi:hypothetical protein